MKRCWKWLVPAVLALTMILTLTGALAESVYGMATADKVAVRKKPSTDADYWFRIDTGFVCEILDVTAEDGTSWYKVESIHPDASKDNTYIGYVHGDFFRPMTDEEVTYYLTGSAPATDAPLVEEVWQGSGTATLRPSTDNVFGGSSFDVGIMSSKEPTATPMPNFDPGAEEDGADDAVTLIRATGEVTASGTNFRLTPSLKGELIGKLNAGAVVELLTIPEDVGVDYWYRVRYNGQEGYIQSNYVRVLTVGYTPTPAPSSYGYAKLLYDSANLRDAPGGATRAQWEGKGSMLKITGPAQVANGYEWYPVYYGVEGKTYYVREDVFTLVSDSGTVVVPTAAPGAGDSGSALDYGYVITTKAGVNLRLKPGGETVAQVPRKTIVPCVGPAVSPADSSYTWYYVEYENLRGYLRGDCVRVCSADGGDIVVTPTPVPTQAVIDYGYIKLIKDKVNFRIRPAGTSQGQLPQDLILPVTGPYVTSGKYDWYPVRTADGLTGFIRSDCLMVCDEYGNKPAAPTPTPAPTGNPTLSTYGYIHITEPRTNLRDSVDGETIHQLAKESVWPLIGRPVTYKQMTWYPVVADGYTGFVRGDCAFKLSAAQELAYLSGQGVPVETTPPPATMSSYLITVLDKVNLRKTASRDSAAPYNVRLGTVIQTTGSKNVGTSKWYSIVYEGKDLWVLGTCVKQMTSAEYEAWLNGTVTPAPGATATPAPTATPTPAPNEPLGYLRTVMDRVYIRKGPNSSTIVTRIENAGTVLPYYAERVKAGNYFWYAVKTLEGADGYIRGDMFEYCDAYGNPLATATPKPGTSNPGTSKPEATYTTLRLGSSGIEVRNLVAELIRQGYYHGSVTSSYTTEVRAAVIRFQQAKGLTVDGIAGSKTQHALFGTVEPGTAQPGDLSFDFYPVEKIDWYTGGIQQLWAKGANYKVYDIKSGLVWWCHRWSGSAHADVEPLTAADTARLCQMYGVDDAQEIYDKNLWQRRPSLVTIGTRTFACSLDGMPHNPAGDTIDNNNMTGQICLHFTNSKGHESGQVSTSHKKAIEEAYEWAKQRYGAK